MRIILSLVLVVFTLSACNTVEGMGQDIKDGARAIDDAI